MNPPENNIINNKWINKQSITWWKLMMEFQTTLHKQLRVIIITLEILILKMRVIKIIIVIIKLLIRRGWGRDVARSMKK